MPHLRLIALLVLAPVLLLAGCRDSGTLRLRNNASETVVVEIKAKGGLRTIVMDPRSSDAIVLPDGKVKVRATGKRSRERLLEKKVVLEKDRAQSLQIFDFHVRPKKVVLERGGSSADHGTLECSAADKAKAGFRAYRRFFSLYYEFSCGKNTLKLKYGTDFDRGNEPAALRSCVDAFERFKTSRGLGYFVAEADPYRLVCGTESSRKALELVRFLQLSRPRPGLPPLTLGPQMGELTVRKDHLPSDPDVKDGYTSYETEGSFNKTYNVQEFRYRTKLPMPSGRYVLQMTNEKSVPLAKDPCAGWKTPAGFLTSTRVPIMQQEDEDGYRVARFQYAFGHVAGPTVVHVRLVPVDLAEKCIGAPTNWVTFAASDADPSAELTSNLNKAIAEAQKKQEEEKKKWEAKKEAYPYDVEILSYVPPKFQGFVGDYQRRYVTTVPIVTFSKNWPAGCAYVVPEGGDYPPWYQQAWEGLLSVFDWVATAYEDLKAYAVNLVAALLPGCDETCRAALEMGLEAGLVAMGLPPSVPNLDQLMNEGADYLAACAAEQASAATGMDQAVLVAWLPGSESRASCANCDCARRWRSSSAAQYRKSAFCCTSHLVRLGAGSASPGS